MEQSEKQKHHWLEILKIIFDFAVIIVMVVSLNVAYKANEISRTANKLTSESLRKSYVPWLQVISLEPPVILDSNRVEIVHGCQNYADAPALDLYIKYTISDVSIVGESPMYVSNPLMPNYEGKFNCIFTAPTQAKHIAEKLSSGESSIGFDIHFEDVFGRKFLVHQECKCIEGTFRMTKYEIDGIDDL